MGDEIAQALLAPLDVLVARKIGAPFNPELGVGAVAGDSDPVYDEKALATLDLTPEQLAPTVERERAELHRREEAYRAGRPPPAVRDRSVVVADDGLATGVTARAALRNVRAVRPARLVLAVPVCSPQAEAALKPVVDDLVCLHKPASLGSVGQWYDAFDQVDDAEVIETLRSARATR